MANIAMENPRTAGIRERAETLRPPYLLHFTNVSNLPSIMRNGLCPVATLAAAANPFQFNDHLRLDGHKDAVSLSISHPNDRMFYKYRLHDPKQKWAVLVFEPEILWLLPTAFNRYNAADKRMSRLSKDERISVEAFDAMFLPDDNLHSREVNKLLPYDPTDVQAELLVFDVIPSIYVSGVVFGDDDSLKVCAAEFGNRRCLSVNPEGAGFFGARANARKTGWTY